ncbi:sterol desaturase family protein [Paucibacter sp. APW11]|uniref:Sterol desaturase family protein n=1 Tax=Roseateles aquae TaxID=3077235 RepID=A0ABU3P5B5_9BURK|nr:sterol desaturase family protein [Paucibacter sp. APW11]MDT8997759.1 sterol desaturase family protein [Paucibacter sp. APW11]
MTSMELSRKAYIADFVVYTLLVAGLGLWLAASAPWLPSLGLLLLGALSWSLLEYLLHRWVLHELPPFCNWHADHHRRPGALIAAPTWLSAGLLGIATLPAWWWLQAWQAGALSLGLSAAYLGYGVAHHLAHHPWRGPSLPGVNLAGFRRRHALHHRGSAGLSPEPCNYGVSTGAWDWFFQSAPRRR